MLKTFPSHLIFLRLQKYCVSFNFHYQRLIPVANGIREELETGKQLVVPPIVVALLEGFQHEVSDSTV